MEQEVLGRIHSFESFASADGPGVRSLLFLQGCAMRCQYCHNPDTWDMNKGSLVTAEEMLQKALRYKRYWGKNGGITVSGGEALWQIDFVIKFFTQAKQKNIHTAVDTAGNPFTMEEPFISKFEELCKVTDLFLLDIKHMDDDAHRKLTKHSNQNILQMAKYLSDHGKDMWIRHVLVPGVTDSKEQLESLRDFLSELKTVKKVEVLPYHTLGVFKWEQLGVPYELQNVKTPTREEVERAKSILGILE